MWYVQQFQCCRTTFCGHCIRVSGVFNMSCYLVITIVALLGSTSAQNYPDHAECTVEWQIPLGCDAVRSGLIDIMGDWAGDENNGRDKCPTTSAQCPRLPCGQRCLYTYKAQESSQTKLFGVHLTPAKLYSDSFNFELTENGSNGGCSVKGYSTSDLWYAILDQGTNYCNLRNLLDGAFETKWEHPDNAATLDDWEGFQEDTRNSKCTQYGRRNCNRY